jgi:hypothetical protein
VGAGGNAVTWLYPVLFALTCWYAFAMCVSVYRKWVDGKLSPFNKAVFMPPLLVFMALDVVGNYTVFMVFGAPPAGAHTISQRLSYYRTDETGFKQFVAVTLCDLLSELDPTGSHC